MAKKKARTANRVVNEAHYEVRPGYIRTDFSADDLPDECGDKDAKEVILAAVYHCQYVGGWEAFTVPDLYRWSSLSRRRIREGLNNLVVKLNLLSIYGQEYGRYAMTSPLIDLLYQKVRVRLH